MDNQCLYATAGNLSFRKDSGIEVTESVAGNSYTNTGFGPQVMVRNDLQQRLTECHQKMQEHSKSVKTFCGWIAVLEGNPNDALTLHADDYLFFFGD